jgi:RNA polymerase sigma-70 factor (ECF subfamily)
MVSNSRSEQDLDLLQRWREGDQAAGNCLVRWHYSSVFRFFRSKLPSQLEDLTQEVFTRAFADGERFDSERGSFRSYLLGIARHLVLQQLRKDGRGVRVRRVEAASVCALAGSPSVPLAAAQELQLLLRALCSLPIALQMTLELYYWEGLSCDELAHVLAIPRGTVMSRLARARQALRRRLLEMNAPTAVRLSAVRDLDRWARELASALERE